jgi:tRNA G18 (ribose-2'-O)-methylase SpoU
MTNSYFDPKTDTRNVADEFKGMSTDAIRLEMQPRRTPLVNIVMNLTSDFNKSSVLRAANAHAAREFIMINRINDQDPTNPQGAKKFDNRGAVGMVHYETVRHTTDWKSVFAEFREQGYTIYAVDNNVAFGEPKVIYNTVLPEKTVFVYGEEGLGLSNEMLEACDEMVYIPQFGVVRSLNISQAAAVCMYEYSRQHQHVL